jgi:tetratricopeptide (TPR) repeat protein
MPLSENPQGGPGGPPERPEHPDDPAADQPGPASRPAPDEAGEAGAAAAPPGAPPDAPSEAPPPSDEALTDDIDERVAARVAALHGDDEPLRGEGEGAPPSAASAEEIDPEEVLSTDDLELEPDPDAGAPSSDSPFGPPDPIRLAAERAAAETYAERIDLYEREIRLEPNRARAALLEHEIGDQLERLGQDEAGAVKAYARSLSSDPMLRPNLWAVRRIFYQRKLWPSLLKLLDAETRYASSDAERAELWTERGHVLEDCIGDLDEAVNCYRTAHKLDPMALAPLSALEKVFARQDDRASLIEVYRALAAATLDPGRRVALLFDLARIEEAEHGQEPPAEGEPTAIERALSYLHAAYEVGVDQLQERLGGCVPLG